MSISPKHNQQLLLDIFKAYEDAKRHKGNTSNALRFAENYEHKLFKLYDDILHRKYVIGQSVCFIVHKPVQREIFAADFRDRIVHHLIFNYINPIFEKHFIKDSYSCRIGKGTSKGIQRIQQFMRSCSENYQKDCWILKLDIQGYFMSIDRIKIFEKIKKRLSTIRNPDFDRELILYLIEIVIFHDPTTNCYIKGKRSDWNGLPKSKSLFYAHENKGFPIGNLTSQLFGNIYLDEFDHWIKERYRMDYYGRYVDDMIFIHVDKDFLTSIVKAIQVRLKDSLGLQLHPKKIYLQKNIQGVHFLGAYVKPWRIYIGKKTKSNCITALTMWNKKFENSNSIHDQKEIDAFVSCMNSYLGLMKQYKTGTLRKKVIKKFTDRVHSSIDVFPQYGKIKAHLL